MIPRVQEEQLLGNGLPRCRKLALNQRGQYSPLSLVFTAQLICGMIDAPTNDDKFTGESWAGLNIGQAMELIFGDTNRDQA